MVIKMSRFWYPGGKTREVLEVKTTVLLGKPDISRVFYLAFLRKPVFTPFLDPDSHLTAWK